ncbi:MAG: DUF4445 domain-containing protein [Ruminiclostridium sp.]|nr:DUF4445 domain-containing protein [Ruminiclostridium sp.]
MQEVYPRCCISLRIKEPMMPKFTVRILPYNKTTEIDDCVTLLEALLKMGITFNNLCGGNGTCGRCKLLVLEGNVYSRGTGKLTAAEIEKGYVLACQSYPVSDAVVEVPRGTMARAKETAGKDADIFVDSGYKAEDYEYLVSPVTRKVFTRLEGPTIARSIADHQNLCEAVKEQLKLEAHIKDSGILMGLPDILRQNNFEVTSTVSFEMDYAEIIGIEAKNTADKNYSVIVDIGTTTVVAHLIDMNSYKSVNAKACFNSQGAYGRELTSRIISAEKHGKDRLHELIIQDINNLIESLVIENRIDPLDINAVVCVGNTVMTHFLLNLPTYNIRRYPYVAASVDTSPVRAGELKININPKGLIYTLPGISAWVGSDVTVGVLACGMHKREEISLLIDIGTNGEIVIGNKQWLVATSASAGPSLEGASVECGMRAEEGAIEKVFAEEGRILYKTIGNAPIKGICGSGIIDFIAVLLNEKIINRSGKFIKGSSKEVTCEDGINRFTLKDGNNPGRFVYLTENDIENVIAAKAAIYAAVKILLKRLSLSFSQISRFFICGAFGNHLNLKSAVAIGLIPDLAPENIEFAGNTAIKGSKMFALNKDFMFTLKEICKMTTYYDLIGANDYVEEFTKAMFLPHTDIEEFASI